MKDRLRDHRGDLLPFKSGSELLAVWIRCSGWLASRLLAATINGALGYGFSSITVPLALLFLSNRVLNPALVIIEVPLNAYVLWVNRAELPGVWRRVFPLIVGLVPGVVTGTLLVSRVSPDWLKLYTFVVLLPLILLQAAGVRRPIQAERSAGLIFGSGIGVLYSVTTISGPPLAIALNNQGFAKKEFRAALGVVRLAESSLTAIAYVYAGLFLKPSFALLPWIIPSVAIGVPDRGVHHSPDARRDIPANLYELRRVGGCLWPVEAHSRREIDPEQRRLFGPRGGDRDRCPVALSIFLGPR